MVNKSEIKYVVREVATKKRYRGQFVDVRSIIIGIEDINKGIIYPSPLTNFIMTNYENMGNSLSAQSNPASEVCKFLNYVWERVQSEDPDFRDLKGQGIYGLKLIHGSRYITYKTREGLQHKSVKRIERYLTHFYVFLEEEKIIGEFDKKKKVNHIGKGEYFLSPFRKTPLQTEYPSKQLNSNEDAEMDALKDFGKNRILILTELIMTARAVCPEIALGLCFQFFGGLRRSEDINLTKSSLEISGNNGSDMFILKVRDNQNKLFSKLKNTRNEQVKRPRNQTLLLCDLLSDVYEEHMDMLKQQEKKFIEKQTRKPASERKNWNPAGLFMSSRTGQPISGENYAEKFKAVKKAFLKKLREKRRFDDYELLNTKWATHIGRGVFTNFLMSLGMNVTQVAIARGDRNLDSALAYFEERNLIENMQNALQEIRNEAKQQEALMEVEKAFNEKKSDIETSRIVKWKELYRVGSRV